MVLKFERTDGKEAWINPEHVIHLTERNGFTRIDLLVNEWVEVTSSPDEVASRLNGPTRREILLEGIRDAITDASKQIAWLK